MARGRTIVGAAVLCALAVCVLGVASAVATTGLTAVECEAKVGGNFNTSQCATPAVPGNFETVPFALNASTAVEATSVGDITLTGTVALAKIDITCQKATSTGGSIKNVTPGGAGAEMKIEGSGGVSHYEECTARFAADTGVNKEACKIKAITGGQGVGKITTTPMKGSTGPEHTATVEPEAGTTFTEFEILKEAAEAGKVCNLPGSKVTVTGKVSGIANTENHSHGTITGGGASLKVNGAAATLTATTAAHTPAPNTAKVVGAMTFP